jgi:outer membrane protein with beta-barrel domain
MQNHLLLIKKTGLLSSLIVFSFIGHGQTRFGIFAGPQSSSAKYSIVDVKQPCKNKYGFQAGVGWKVEFENQLYFAPEAFYSLKGYKVKFNHYSFPPDTAAVDNNTSIHTFELAFLLQYDLGKKPDHLFIKAGPSLDFQLAGKEKFNLKTGGSVDRSMVYGFTAYGHYLASLLVQLGYESRTGFMIFGQYTLGLMNVNNADGGPQIMHRAYGICVGKYFNKKRIARRRKK